MVVVMMIPVRGANWVALMSSSPSEMCFSAASVSAVTVLLLLLELESSEEVEGDTGVHSARADRDAAGERGGGRKGEQGAGSSSATNITLPEEKQFAFNDL